MSDEAALLQAIYTNPDDDTPRLVYADWLDEHDQLERAEFIRVQIELANRGDDSTDATQRLGERERALWETHGEEWTEGFVPFTDVGFVRGFPEIVGLHDRDGVSANFDSLRHLPALRRLEVRAELNPDALRTIASLRHLEALRIWVPFDPSWLVFLDSLPCWTYVYTNPLSYDAREEWEEFQERRISRVTRLAPDQHHRAAIRYVRGLDWDNQWLRPDRPFRSAEMWNIHTIDAELRMLAYLPELEEVKIHRCHVTATGLRHLSNLPNLKKIELSETRCDSLVPLMNCTTLEHLNYYGEAVPFGDESVAGLERLTNLRHLELCVNSWGTGLRDATLHRIGALRQLRHLGIDLGTRNDAAWTNCMVDPLWFASMLENKSSLIAIANLTNLESFSVNGAEYTGSELREFLERLRRQ